MAVRKKTLVVCVDRDDDFGKKAKLKGPFVGEEDNLKAAQALALKDPTESDANAVYGALKAYRELKKGGENAEIITITGHRDRDQKADNAIVDQLEHFLKKWDVKGVILVSDGADDDQVLPLIQSRVKLLSVRTIIVKQAKELEKSYYVVKELLRDPHFARLVFGLPGIVIGAYAVVQLLGIQQLSMNVIMAIVGAYLVLKGFGLEDAMAQGLSSFTKTTSIERASFPLYVGSALLFLLSLWAGADNIGFVWDSVPAGIVIKPAYVHIVNIAAFLLGSIGIFTLAVVLFFTGRIGDMYYRREYYKIRKYARSIVSMAAMFVIGDAVGRFALFWTDAIAAGPSFADLFVAVGEGFIITLAGFLVVKYLYMKKYVKPRIQKGLAVSNNYGEDLGKISHIDYRNDYFYYSKGSEKTPISFNKVLKVSQAGVIIA